VNGGPPGSTWGRAASRNSVRNTEVTAQIAERFTAEVEQAA
jgi:hypothetical protein